MIDISSMTTSATTTDYLKLSVSERIQLVEDIWDSIAAEASNTVELSQAQMAELHRRVAEHRADPSTAVPWEQVRSKLFSGKP
ncbi:MAG: addiction module protein [Chlorobium sp.]